MECIETSLQRVATKEWVPAQLCDEITDAHVELWRSTWIPSAQEIHRRRESAMGRAFQPPVDLYWNWKRKVEWARSAGLGKSTFSLTSEGALQGMVIFDVAAHASKRAEAENRPLVYVDFLSAAPWNRPELGEVRLFRGVGTLLMRVAVELSLQLEFKGRVGLHSLKDAEGFYGERCGMVSLGRDKAKENLMCFEMTEDGASKFLEE